MLAELPVRSRFSPLPLAPLPDQPLVSVIVSSYNYARFLPECLESVLEQSYANLELIVCDDGSSDDSPAIIRQFAARDARVLPLFKANGGQASAWNLALEQARGEIICFLDPDDVFERHKLETVVRAFQREPEAGVCLHQMQPISQSGTPIRRPFPDPPDSGWLAERALERGGWGSWPPTSGVSLRRGLVDQLLPIPDYLRRGYCEGYFIGAAQFLTRFVAVNEPLTRYRLHGNNTVSSRWPQAGTITLNLDYHRLSHQAWQGVLRAHYGPETAARLHLDDAHQWYWENLLALYVLRGKPAEGVRGYRRDRMLAGLPEGSKLRAWRMVLRLPSPLDRLAFQLWWGTHGWKGAARAVAGRLGARP